MLSSKVASSRASASVRVPKPPPGGAAMRSSSVAQQQQQGAAASLATATITSATIAIASFDDLLRLLEDPSSATQYERHAAELRLVVEASSKGFAVKHALSEVPRVATHLCRAIQRERAGARVACLFEPLVALVKVAALPLSARTLDDQRNVQQGIGNIADAIASLLLLPHPQIRAEAACTLQKMFSFIRDQCGDDVNPSVDAHLNQKRKEYWTAIQPQTIQAIVAAWSSALGVAVAHKKDVAAQEVAAKKGDDDEDPDEGVLAPIRTPATDANAAEMVHLLKACVELSHYASLCCSLTDAGAALLTCRTMQICSPGDRRLGLSVELLWNLLELHEHTAEACANPAAIQALYEVFIAVLQSGHKKKDREVRNDLIILVTMIAKCPDSLPLLVPFAELLLDLSCGAERETSNIHIHPKFHHTTNHEELQMKVLAWNALEHLCQGSDTYAKAIFDWGLLDVLLLYINIRCEQPAVVRWSTEQLLDLQRNVLNILLLLAPSAAEHFREAAAIPILVEYTHECPDKPLRNLAVAVLAAIARTPMRKQLADCGIIQLALELLQEVDQVDNVLRVDCLCILADVVDRDAQLQEEFLQWDGITTVLPLLRFEPDYFTDLKDAVVFNALDATWSCVTGSTACEAALVREDGVHDILGVLETCPGSMKRFPLTCLADLLRHPSAVVEFRGWVSERTGRSAAQLLLSLWTGGGGNSADDTHNATFLDESSTSHQDGVFIGLRSIGASTKRTTLSARPPSASGVAAADTADVPAHHHVDPNINSEGLLMQRNGLIKVPTDISEIVEENTINFKVYCCFLQVGMDDHKELTALERSVLASVQVFAELCKDEVWTAVADSIENDGLQAVAADTEKLRRVRAVALARCEELQSTRQSLRQAHEDQVQASEDTFYKTLIKKTDEKAPTSKSSTLSITEAKIRKALMLKASFKAAMAKQQAHRTGGGLTPKVPVAPGQATPLQVAFTVPSSTEAGASSAVPASKGGSERWGLGQRAMSDPEFALLQWLNKVRTDPKSLIPHIKEKLKFLNEEGNAFTVPGKPVENCVEGSVPYIELIEMLEAARPIVTLLDVPMGLLLAARDHATDLGKRMEATQEGSDGSTPQMRMNRYGRVGGKCGQLLSLGYQQAADIIIQLAVDDGIASRVDRKAIFDPDMRVCGVAIGKHSIHENVAIVLLAHEYGDKPPNEQRDIYLKFNSPPARKLLP
ncbi:Hypothetical protein, putative [Bodo saltans]|uniref:Cilia- and flagella-associated protein 69 ARM repeats domain-containing protein n=1 Tax=Bodo saltans TaxID=75058 RepID=A0A0S4IJC6_BODSA|nr:Hypothetical protein, putative [Bodo saltans]|eukprot:CUE80041.1 Hypothetical protein, putative [Bodo saltans]